MKCQVTTKNGTQCKRNAVHNKCCTQHAKKSRSPRRSPTKLSPSQREKQRKFCSCVQKIKSKKSSVNPWAVCTASVGRVTNSCKEFE